MNDRCVVLLISRATGSLVWVLGVVSLPLGICSIGGGGRSSLSRSSCRWASLSRSRVLFVLSLSALGLVVNLE